MIHYHHLWLLACLFCTCLTAAEGDAPAEDSEVAVAWPAMVERALRGHDEDLKDAWDDYIDEVEKANGKVVKVLDRAISKAERDGEAVLLKALRAKRVDIDTMVTRDIFGEVVIPEKKGVMAKGNVALAANGAVARAPSRPEEMIDGNTTEVTGQTGFAMGSFPCVFEVELAEAFQLQLIRIQLYDGDKRTYRYRVETSADGETFEPLVDYSEEERQGWQELVFAPRPVKVIRIHGLHNSANSGFHILEVEAYCRYRD